VERGQCADWLFLETLWQKGKSSDWGRNTPNVSDGGRASMLSRYWWAF
jgi:hypothetical protein